MPRLKKIRHAELSDSDDDSASDVEPTSKDTDPQRSENDDKEDESVDEVEDKGDAEAVPSDEKGFTIDDLEVPNVFLLCGKPKKGKTHLLKYLLYHFFGVLDEQRPKDKCFQFGVVFVGTKFNHEYTFLPDKYVFEGYDETKMSQYLDGLKKKVEAKEHVPPNFIVLDDLVGILDTNRGKFTNMVTTFRKTNTSVFILTQYLNKNVSTTCRECVNYAFIFNSKTEKTINAAYEAFGGLFPNKNTFKAHFLKAAAKPFESMLYIETVEDLEKNYYTFKAPGELPEQDIEY